MKKHLLCLIALFYFFISTTNSQENTWPRVSSGTIIRHVDFTSNYISARNVDVWLPDNYSPNQRYKVLYMHDGQMLFDANTTWNKQEWGVDETITRLIQNDSILSTIVVGIWNSGINRHSDYFPQKPFEKLPLNVQDSLIYIAKRQQGVSLFAEKVQSDNYLKFIVNELKPFIDKTYATLTEPEHTYIAGSSMGGLISMYAVCEYPAVFGGAACLSTHWIGSFDTENNPIPAQFFVYLKENLPSPDTHKFYFDYGTETLDRNYEPYQKEVDKILKAKGYTSENWITLKFEGKDHSENAWRERLHIPLRFLVPLDESIFIDLKNDTHEH